MAAMRIAPPSPLGAVCGQSGWYRLLPIRPVNMHSRCDTCAKYSAMRAKADPTGELKAIQSAYHRHVQSVFADRRFMCRLENNVEQATKAGAGAELTHVVLVIDAMDKKQMDDSKEHPVLQVAVILVEARFAPCWHVGTRGIGAVWCARAGRQGGLKRSTYHHEPRH